MMYHIPDVLSADQVAEFTRQLALAEWVDGRVTVGSQGAAVKQNQQIQQKKLLRCILASLLAEWLRATEQVRQQAMLSLLLNQGMREGRQHPFHSNESASHPVAACLTAHC